MQTDPTSFAPAEMRAWFWTNAGFERTGSIPVADRAFRYGMSLFESFPVRAGAGIFLERHLARLREACAMTGFAVPREALEACEPLLAQAPDGFGRIHVTAGDGPVTGAFDACRVLVTVENRTPPSGGAYHRGYELGMHSAGHAPLFAGLKTGNYWANLRAFRDGVAARCNETLLFTPEGLLISACMANVFVVKEGRLNTPALSTGARHGVVREWVMDRAEVTEALLTRADVEAADEIFLTSSWLGIMPGAFIGERPLLDWKAGAPLLAAYRREVDPR